MKNTSIDLKNINLKSLGPLLLEALQKSSRYAGLMFFVLVAGVYGFVILRINTLSTIQPGADGSNTSSASTTEKPATIPKIDPKVVRQLEALKDNSVNVQTLFERARDNPFRE